MSELVSGTQIERFRILHNQFQRDTAWQEDLRRLDARREVVRAEMVDFLHQYLSGQVESDVFKATFDQKTRTTWEGFGLKGLSGAMFLNKMVLYMPDQPELATRLRAVLPVPPDEPTGQAQMQTFLAYLEGLIKSQQVTRQLIQPARAPFFISAWWHMQQPEQWPIFYVSGQETLEREGVWTYSTDLVKAYFSFRAAFLALMQALGTRSWELEQLLAWATEQRKAAQAPSSPTGVAEPPPEPPPVVVATTELPVQQANTGHAQMQWQLAKIGQKLGCKVWIAANDHSRVWNGERLGDLSIKQLPNLGLDPASQRIISLIDVVWVRGQNQLTAAFEVEHTTSIYSGLLRMADLVALAPNLNFPLYIVTPQVRLEDVRRELRRPTFQTLTLHRRCGFFSEEILLQEAPHILRWANSPIAIEELAEKVGDVTGEEIY